MENKVPPVNVKIKKTAYFDEDARWTYNKSIISGWKFDKSKNEHIVTFKKYIRTCLVEAYYRAWEGYIDRG